MTCYFRHLQEIFEKAGVEVTVENKREVDKIIRSIVGVECNNCPATWKEVKKCVADDKQGFVSQLETAWKKHRQ